MAGDTPAKWKARDGAKLGPWTLLGDTHIGSGGNGAVWKARRAGDDTDYALKILSKTAARDPERRGRFENEITFLDGLSDPGVLPMVDRHIAGDESTPRYYVMPMAQPLLDALGPAPTPEVVLDVVATIAETLARLERLVPGFGHRDIKPENLFKLDGKTVVGDFGLVALPDRRNLTRAGRKVGPANFIAPEMLEDAHEAAAGPVDVYSLAKTLWVLLMHRKYPVPGAHQTTEREYSLTPKLGDHACARATDRLLARCTHIRPSARPTMDEFAKELRDIAALQAGDRTTLAGRRGQLDDLARPAVLARQEQDRLRMRFDEARMQVDLSLANVFGHINGTLGPNFRDHFGQQEPNEAYQLLPQSAMAFFLKTRGALFTSLDPTSRVWVRFSVYVRSMHETPEQLEVAAMLQVVHRHDHLEHVAYEWQSTYSALLSSPEFVGILKDVESAVEQAGPAYLRVINGLLELPEDHVPEWYARVRG